MNSNWSMHNTILIPEGLLYNKNWSILIEIVKLASEPFVSINNDMSKIKSKFNEFPKVKSDNWRFFIFPWCSKCFKFAVGSRDTNRIHRRNDISHYNRNVLYSGHLVNVDIYNSVSASSGILWNSPALSKQNRLLRRRSDHQKATTRFNSFS